MEDSLITIVLILAVSFSFSELFFRLKYPRVIGQIMAGMILGLPLFALIFADDTILTIAFLAELGIIFLLLLTGLELNIEKFKKAKKDSIIIAIFCVVLPFFLGFGLMRFAGYSSIIAFVVGAALSLTAEGTKLKVLLDMKALNTKIGTIMLGAGILDDAFEIIFLSAVIFLVKGNVTQLLFFPGKILIFVVIVYLLYKLFPRGLRLIEREHDRVSTFSFILIFGIFIALVSKSLDLGPVIGAFVAGIIIHLSEHTKGGHLEIVNELKVMTFSLIIPFFFINIGLHFDPTVFFTDTWLVIMIIFVATVGKLVGAMAATPFTDLSIGQTHLIGWGMNSRGAVELVVAEIARSYGLIPIEVYSSIVTMAVLTTLAFPIIMKTIIKGKRRILTD